MSRLYEKPLHGIPPLDNLIEKGVHPHMFERSRELYLPTIYVDRAVAGREGAKAIRAALASIGAEKTLLGTCPDQQRQIRELRALAHDIDRICEENEATALKALLASRTPEKLLAWLDARAKCEATESSGEALNKSIETLSVALINTPEYRKAVRGCLRAVMGALRKASLPFSTGPALRALVLSENIEAGNFSVVETSLDLLDGKAETPLDCRLIPSSWIYDLSSPPGFRWDDCELDFA